MVGEGSSAPGRGPMTLAKPNGAGSAGETRQGGPSDGVGLARLSARRPLAGRPRRRQGLTSPSRVKRPRRLVMMAVSFGPNGGRPPSLMLAAAKGAAAHWVADLTALVATARSRLTQQKRGQTLPSPRLQ
ncbi:hypothetical protein NL676_007320 [Syzygium grande]|nr:hypothetical protein NL676_007320 [Syzygium grande]